MAKLSLADKASRVLKLLLGLRSPRVAAAMTAYGFSDADLKEGWTLLQGVSRAKLDAVGGDGVNADVLTKLDEWENRWFPVASATLERRTPAVHAQLFRNLSQTSGPAVAVSVRTFVERYDQMVAGAGGYGAEGAAAKAHLDARGLTAATVNEARALLETVGKTSTQSAMSTLEDDEAKFAKAEADLWAWYLEWSQIARVAVTQRALLKQMGFVASRGRKDVDDDEEPADGATPAAPTGPIPA